MVSGELKTDEVQPEGGHCLGWQRLTVIFPGFTLECYEVSLLFALRSRTMKSVINNFGMKVNCSLGCSTLESQEHWLLCQETLANENTPIVYSDIFGNITEQMNIVKLFSKLEEERNEQRQRAAHSSPVA